MSHPTDADARFRPALLAARRLHRSGAGTVLEALTRGTPRADWPALFAWLQDQGGVRAAADAAAVEPVPGLLDRGDAQDIGCIALKFPDEAFVRIGLADPWDEDLVGRLVRRLGRMPQLAAVGPGLLPGLADASKPAPARPDAAAPAATIAGPVVDFVDAALQAAFTGGASDIHFECDRAGVAVRFRLDGVLQAFARLDDPRRAEEVISRIKVLAQLDITERRIPQDGRFRFVHPAGALDLRVSIMPSVHGEDAVLRLLDKAQLRSAPDGISLDQLGFAPATAAALRALAELPHGMLLVTGPTGSGKTTTVYAVLSEIHRGLEKIVTIEDPVEYELPGVLQIPVNDRKGLTFARGLRSILRHDPDRILVGEIRDPETAQIAVQSALTGHQVFTTVHANHVFDVIGRFRHFGLDMYGFMSALNGVVVQRLVRTCCPCCSAERPADERERQWLAGLGQAGARVPAAPGCERCRGTGYRGRIVLAEVHVVDDALRDGVTGLAPLATLRSQVERDGVPALHRQAAALVAARRTTIEEIRRVVGWR